MKTLLIIGAIIFGIIYFVIIPYLLLTAPEMEETNEKEYQKAVKRFNADFDDVIANVYKNTDKDKGRNRD